jgi:ParB family chromosome partitioning protein
MGHARAILAVDDKDMQLKIAQDIIANGLSVRDTENLIKKFKSALMVDAESQDGESRVVVARFEALVMLETRIKERLRSFVAIKGSAKKGKISIAYESEEELNAISQKLLS